MRRQAGVEADSGEDDDSDASDEDGNNTLRCFLVTEGCVSAEMDGNMARIWVRYEAELGDGETTRTARELWAYMHDVTANDPNWILDDVEEAK